MGAIAQFLEILGHQSEVGVEASGFLIINNKVLKSIDLRHFYLVENSRPERLQLFLSKTEKGVTIPDVNSLLMNTINKT